MTYLCSINNHKICYVNKSEELVLSDVNGSNHNVINSDTAFVNSIIGIILIDDYIVLRTMTDDIYHYNIIANQLVLLGNYFVVKIICWQKRIHTDFCCCTLVISDRKITLFTNFIISDELTLPLVNPIINFFSIGRDDYYYACTSSDKTVVFENEIVIVVILDRPYKSLEISNCGYYYCLLADGNIDVYNIEWIHIHTINFKQIVTICCHRNVSLIDSDQNYYKVFFGELSNTGFVRINGDHYVDTSHMELVYSTNNFHIFLASKHKYLLTLYGVYGSYIIFDACVIYSGNINTGGSDTSHHCDYNFNNVRFFEKCGKYEFIFIDDDDVVRLNYIQTYASVRIESSICNYVIKKLTKMTNTKSAKFVLC